MAKYLKGYDALLKHNDEIAEQLTVENLTNFIEMTSDHGKYEYSAELYLSDMVANENFKPLSSEFNEYDLLKHQNDSDINDLTREAV